MKKRRTPRGVRHTSFFGLGARHGQLDGVDYRNATQFLPALYFALRQLARSTLVIAALFNTLFVALDVGIDIPLSLSLVRLSASYSAAQGATQQAYVAAAGLAMDVGGVASLIATFLQFSAVILVSYAMLKTSAFGKATGVLGVVSGVVALLFIPTIIIGSPLAGHFNIGGFALLVLWSLLTGYRLYRI